MDTSFGWSVTCNGTDGYLLSTSLRATQLWQPQNFLTIGIQRRLATTKNQPASIFRKLKLTIPPQKAQYWRYWLRLAIFFTVTLVIALACLPLTLGALFMAGLLHTPCAESRMSPADYSLSAESVSVPSQAGGAFRGYFIPGSNGATIIMPPPLASGRSVRLPQAAMLARHGYAIFLFESRRCANLGPLSLGYREVDDVTDAVDYLVARQDVDPDRIGIHGFSSAGATSIMATARLPVIRAVVAEGGYGHFADSALGSPGENVLTDYFLALYRWATLETYRRITGLDVERLSPVSVIEQIAPRPILLIYGSLEVSLPGGRRQYVAAGSNAQLWVVAGAGHGNYMSVAPEAYESRIVTFFDKALLTGAGEVRPP
jgi:hypothetical protein